VHLTMPQDRALSLATLYGYDDVGRLSSVGESEVPPLSGPAALLRALNTASNSVTYSFGVGGRMVSSNIQLANSSAPWNLSNIAYNSSGQMVTRQFVKDAPVFLAGLPVNTMGLTETFNYDPKNLLEQGHTATALPAVSDLSICLAPPCPPPPPPPLDPKLFDTSNDYTRRQPNVDGASHVGLIETMPPVGQLVRRTDAVNPQGNEAFSYDQLGRLSQATLGVATSVSGESFESRQSYHYDRYGNRVAVDVAAPANSCGNPTCPLSSDRADGWPQLSIDPGSNHEVQTGVAYDEAGNVVAAPRPDGQFQQYRYDAAGRLVTVLDPAGNLLERYVYGSTRRRVLTLDAAGNATAYGWDGTKVVAEYDVPSGAHRFNVPDNNGTLVSFAFDGHGKQTVHYRIGDRNSVRVMVDADAATALTPSGLGTAINARPFGVSPPGQASAEPIQSYRRSAATGLDYALNRFYDPARGRFLQPDPLGIGASRVTEPQSLNLYSFVSNDPKNSSDPLGLVSRCEQYIMDHPGEYITCVGDTGPAGSSQLFEEADGGTPIGGPPNVPDLPGGGGGGGGGTQQQATAKSATQSLADCRNQALQNMFGSGGAKAVDFLSLGSIRLDWKGYAKSFLESALVKGVVIGSLPSVFRYSAEQNMRYAFLQPDYTPSQRLSYLAEANEDLAAAETIETKVIPIVGEVALAAGVAASYVDFNTQAFCQLSQSPGGVASTARMFSFVKY
jgi:RHS repeat-associated protein